MSEFIFSDVLLDAMQWPAMAATLLAAWLVGARRSSLRFQGFIAFIVSNFLWIAWGWHADAYAVILLQVGLFVLNIRGLVKNRQR